MFSRLYYRNVATDESSKKSNNSNRVRITLEDRLNSKDISFSLSKNDNLPLNSFKEDTTIRRSNTIGRVLQNGNQQVFYPINPNNTFAVQRVRGCYNSNIVQNNHSKNLYREFSDDHLLRARTDELQNEKISKQISNDIKDLKHNYAPKTEPSMSRNQSELSSMEGILEYNERENIDSQLINEESENERINTKRENSSLSFGLFTVNDNASNTKVSESPLYINTEDKIDVNENVKLNIIKDDLLERSISLKKEKLPSLEILSDNKSTAINKVDQNISDPISIELYKLRGLFFKNNTNELPKLNKASFLLVRFNLLLHLAAIVIQCYFRRFLCRKYYKLRKIGPLKLLNNSALQIQACWRSFLTRFCKNTNKSLAKKDTLKCFFYEDRVFGYNWSYLHEKYISEINHNRNSSAKCIQLYWKNVYIHNLNIKRNILINSILSARSIAKETIENHLIGYITRKRMDSTYRLVPVKWGWSIQDINSIYILLKIKDKWSEPKKMWFSQEDKLFKYNLILAKGDYQIVFKVYYNKDLQKSQDFEILCDSSLETISNSEFQYVNNIKVSENQNQASAFKYLRNIIQHLETIEDLDYFALSPSHKKTSNYFDNSIDEFNTPNYLKDRDTTPSTNVDFSPDNQSFIH